MELILIVIPVFLIFGLGYIGQKKIGFDIANISKAYVYLIAPFLAFRTFFQNKLSFDYLYMALFIILLCTIIICIVKIIGKLQKYTEKEMCGMILGATFMNNGNYGVPVSLFAFGTIGLDYAIVLMVMQSLLANTVGIYYAAKGSSRNYDMANSLKAVLRMPVIYGALGGLLWQALRIPMPDSIFSAIDMIADAGIPLLMITLGMQLANISLSKIPMQKVTIALILRMAASPVIAIGIAYLLPVEDVLGKVMILTAAMPTAAYVTMLSLQFDTEPDLVTSTTFIGTLISLLTIPVVLFFLI